MASADPVLAALARLEERLVERVDERLEQRLRDLRLDMAGSFDAVHRRLDRLEIEYEMLKAGVERLEADVGTLMATSQRIEGEIQTLKVVVERIEAVMARDGADRQDLRDEVVELRRRLTQLDERVRMLEGRRQGL